MITIIGEVSLDGQYVQVLIDNSTRDLIQSLVDKYGSNLRVTVSKISKPRTLPQNNLLHGLATQLAAYTGHTLDEIKDFSKMNAIRRGYPVKNDSKGEVIYSPFTGDPIPISSAEATTEQLSYLVEELYLMASMVGLVVDHGQI